MSAIIRRATRADAEVLSALAADTFSETFGHLYPPEDLADFLTSYSVETVRAELADPALAHWLVEKDGVAVGHAKAGPGSLPHPEMTPECGELKRLYLLKGHQGGGTGSQLMETALEWLGPRRVWLSVWSENHGAQRFYARYGFEKVGEFEFPVGRVRDREFILSRSARG